MTTRRIGLRRRNDLSDLTFDQRRELLHGCPLMGPMFGFASENEMREAWELHRTALREEWRRENRPATRCFAEWLFELVPAYGERRTTKSWERCEPYRENWLTHGILHTSTEPPLQESQAEYLQRNDELQPEEIAFLERGEHGS